ncbi:unnamed protein product [Heligmosomoides polygyrus]|uniref:Ubiquitin conjugation factor E4 A n=1 Tax=Heligmosomoides polygyrus TaxID=6339 RepID=A0A183FV47_HELPZ|nr:unnamed protein product [Heligmosomoides polygyrus]
MSNSDASGAAGQPGAASSQATEAGKPERKRYTIQDVEALGYPSNQQLLESVVGNPTYYGIQFASQGGLTPSKASEIDWDELQVNNNVKWRKYPPIMLTAGKSTDVLHPYTVILFTASYGAPIPINWSQTGDIAVAMCLNMAGWIEGNYTLSKSFLELNYHNDLVNDAQDYSWDVLGLVESKIRPEFKDRPASGAYESMNDLHQRSRSQSPAPGEASAENVVRNPEAEAFVGHRPVMPTLSVRRERGRYTATPAEEEALKKIKALQLRRQLLPAGVALSYLLTCLVAKSSQHVKRHAEKFAEIPAKYGLNLDPGLTFKFQEEALNQIRNSVTGFQSCVAIYLLSVEEKYKAATQGFDSPEQCRIQLKAMLEIRLSFYGMVMPSLGLNVAEKLGPSAELLAVLSGSDKTAASCRVFLNFLSRLKGQDPKYRTERNLGNSSIIDPHGAFRFCRLLNQDYMISLAGAKNKNLTFLWMFIQRNLEEPTDAKVVRDSDRIFSGIQDGTLYFLDRFGRGIINRYSGGDTIRYDADDDGLMALLTKKEILDEQNAGHRSGNYHQIATTTPATQTPVPTIPDPKAASSAPSLSAFEAVIQGAAKPT